MKVVKTSLLKKKKPPKLRRSRVKLHQLDWLEWLTIGLGFWFLFYPKPYKLLLAILLIMPILGLFLNGLHKPSIASLVEIDLGKNGEDKYDVADFIDFAAWVILLRVLIDFQCESLYSLIIPGTITFVGVLGVLFMTHKLIEKSHRNKWWIYTSVIFNIFIYSYGATYAINCTYDNSIPIVYETKVLSKYIHRGRKNRKTHYIKIAPWGHHLETEDKSISKRQYENFKTGDVVKIDVKKGVFNIPWYYIE